MLGTRVRLVVTAPETTADVPDCITEPTTVFVLYVPDFATQEGNARFIDELRGYKCLQGITTSPWESDQSNTATLTCVCDDDGAYLETLNELKPLAKKYARQHA